MLLGALGLRRFTRAADHSAGTRRKPERHPIEIAQDLDAIALGEGATFEIALPPS